MFFNRFGLCWVNPKFQSDTGGEAQMTYQTTRTHEHEDKIQFFFALFSNDSVFIGGKKYPLGQIARTTYTKQ